jgi:hypothetical protein
MAGTANRVESLRFNRRETGRLGLALALSLLAHLLAWGGYEAAKDLGVTQWMHRLAWLPPVLKLAPPARPPEPPLEFVTVEQPSPEAPKNAKFYSNNNSLAANPEANQHANVPKLNGTQTDVPKTETVLKPDFNKLQPAPKPPPAQRPQESSPPQLAMNSGDLTLGKPDLQPPQPNAASQPRPRTLQEALAQMHRSPGLAMKQNGGVPNVKLSASFDVKATPLGQYDSDFVDAVTYRWYSLLESQQFALDRTGKVKLRFHLNYDGTISDMTVEENTVGILLGYVCQKAINDPAPYPPWPEEMRRLVGKNYREITFIFYYY